MSMLHYKIRSRDTRMYPYYPPLALQENTMMQFLLIVSFCLTTKLSPMTELCLFTEKVVLPSVLALALVLVHPTL